MIDANFLLEYRWKTSIICLKEAIIVVKQIRFNENDTKLIEKITEHQRAHGLSSFIAAVRKLCKDALEIEKIRH